MNVDLRIVFLVLLGITGLLFLLRPDPIGGLRGLLQVLLDFLLVVFASLTVLIFALVLTRTDPTTLVLNLSSQVVRLNVSFLQAIPTRLANTLAVETVTRRDTDGDGFDEWVVFYRFDLQTGRSPIEGTIYDSDRGNPPVIFPYQLRVPGRDYLSEGAINIGFAQIPPETMGPEEILVRGVNELSIFRFVQNTQEWESPRDNPPRYQNIGFFRGSGGVSFNEGNGEVTVINRDLFERSQLVWRSVYAPRTLDNGAVVTYYESPNPPLLAPPIMETIDFFQNPPDDILNTTFPEKIVLGFYASTCDSWDISLCRNANDGWVSADFLAPDDNPGQESALREFNNGNAAYFGLTTLDRNQDITVKKLRYYPQIERASAELVATATPDFYTGLQPQGNCVEVTLGNPAPGESASLAFGVRFVQGQWKLERRLELAVCRGVADATLGDAFVPPTPTPAQTSLPPLGPPTGLTPGADATQIPSFSQ